jgi:hypothetical protein
MAIKPISLLLLLCYLLSTPMGAFACSCSPYDPSPRKAVEEFLNIHDTHKTVIFLGKVTSVHDGREERTITFAVNKCWHTKIESEIEVRTGWGGGDCGYHFEEGQTYLVFASNYRDYGWHTSVCSPTTRKPTPFLKVLGEGKKPKFVLNATRTKRFDATPYNIAGITLMAGSIVFSYFLTTREQRRKSVKPLPPA